DSAGNGPATWTRKALARAPRARPRPDSPFPPTTWWRATAGAGLAAELGGEVHGRRRSRGGELLEDVVELVGEVLLDAILVAAGLLQRYEEGQLGVVIEDESVGHAARDEINADGGGIRAGSVARQPGRDALSQGVFVRAQLAHQRPDLGPIL